MFSLSLSLSLRAKRIPQAIAGMLLLMPALPAQGPGYGAWDGPYTWFPEQTKWEIEHAAVIGKPGPHRGKVVLVRDHILREMWLWDPASPTSVEPYGTEELTPDNNIACGGMSWDKDGDWIVAGGDRPQACGSEPIWGHVFYPDQWSMGALHRMPDMLLPASPMSAPHAMFGYYYPTTLAMPDGRVISLGGFSGPWDTAACGPMGLGGRKGANYWQVFDKATGSWLGQSATEPFPGLLPFPTYTFGAYPRVFLLTSGHLFLALQTGGSRELTPPPQSQQLRYSPSAYTDVLNWPPVAGQPPWNPHPYASRMPDGLNPARTVNLQYPTAALRFYRIGQGVGIEDEVIVIGGHDMQPETWPIPLSSGHPRRLAENNVWHITNPMQGGIWQRNPYGPLHQRRVFGNVVITPDLQLTLLGGTENFYSPGQPTNDPFEPMVAPVPVYDVETFDMLNPDFGWQQEQQPHQSYRGYHSIAVLLKDGRILHGSGWKKTVDPPAPAPAFVHTDAEVYTPPCLQYALPRPTIVNAPTTIRYGQAIPAITVTISDPAAYGVQTAADAIDFVTLIRCGSVTHHFDADQRCIRLDITGRPSNNTITVASLPPHAPGQPLGGPYIAPPGYYFLFAVTKPDPQTQRRVQVPSVATFVHITP